MYQLSILDSRGQQHFDYSVSDYKKTQQDGFNL